MEELEEIVFLSDFHYSKENWDQILELDNRFHEMVYEACASKELTRVLRDYHHYLQRIRRITLEEKARLMRRSMNTGQLRGIKGKGCPDSGGVCQTPYPQYDIQHG